MNVRMKTHSNMEGTHVSLGARWQEPSWVHCVDLLLGLKFPFSSFLRLVSIILNLAIPLVNGMLLKTHQIQFSKSSLIKWKSEALTSTLLSSSENLEMSLLTSPRVDRIQHRSGSSCILGKKKAKKVILLPPTRRDWASLLDSLHEGRFHETL